MPTHKEQSRDSGWESTDQSRGREGEYRPQHEIRCETGKEHRENTNDHDRRVERRKYRPGGYAERHFDIIP